MASPAKPKSAMSANCGGKSAPLLRQGNGFGLLTMQKNVMLVAAKVVSADTEGEVGDVTLGHGQFRSNIV